MNALRMIRSIVLGVGLALVVSLLTPATATATESSLTDSDNRALRYLQQQGTPSVVLLMNSPSTMWLNKQRNAHSKYISFGWYSVTVSLSEAKEILRGTPDGSVTVNHRYTIPKSRVSSAIQPLGVRGSSNASLIPQADFVSITSASQVHAAGNRGAGQSVAIIDTGIYDSHAFFKDSSGTNSRIVAQACFLDLGPGYTRSSSFYGCLNGQSSQAGDHAANISGGTSVQQQTLSHGTHVAGIAAGNRDGMLNPPNELTNGMAPDAGIVAVRVFGDDNAYDVDILAALGWVRANAAGYNIASVNLSLGSGPAFTCADVPGYEQYATSFNSLVAAGVAPVLASGNDYAGTSSGAYNDSFNPYGLGVGFPGCVDPGISVASSDPDDLISSFSDVGPGIDFAAPGQWILSSVPYLEEPSGFSYYRGTSMASPVVAGAFALAKAADSSIPISAWENFMKQSGTLIDDVIIQNIPRLNIAAALMLSGSLAPPSDVAIRWPSFSSFTLTWSSPTYGPAPTGYRISANGITSDVSGSTFSFSGSLLHPDTPVTIASLSGADISSGVTVSAMPTSTSVSRVARLTSVFVESALLGGDECTAAVNKRLVIQYDSPSFANRTLVLIDGEGNAQTLTESKPSPVPNNLSATYAKQIVIANPADVVKSTSKLYYFNNLGSVGIPYSLSNAFSLIQNSPASPLPVTNLTATPGFESAQISWSDSASTSWRLLVDGVLKPNVTSRSVTLSLAAGAHTVGICAIKNTSNGEYTSTRQETTFTVSNKQSQTITASVAETLALSNGTTSIAASASSGLAVTYSSLTSSVCSVSGSGVITALQGGTCSVRVSQAGNSQYLEATSSTLNVRILLPQSIETTVVGNKTWGDSPFALDSQSSAGRDLIFASATPAVCLAGEITGVVSLIGAGQCRIDVTAIGAPNFVNASAQVVFTVLRPKATVVRTVKSSVSSRKLSLTWIAPLNASKAAISKYVIKYRVGKTGAWKTVNVTSRQWKSGAFAKGVRVYFSITANGARGMGATFTGNRLIS